MHTIGWNGCHVLEPVTLPMSPTKSQIERLIRLYACLAIKKKNAAKHEHPRGCL